MSKVEELIDRVMAEHPGLGVTAQARYYEDVHQHLAPLAREIEKENEKLRSLLRRGLKQLAQWQEKYGEFDPKWVPPAGDVRWAEDVDVALTPNARANARP